MYWVGSRGRRVVRGWRLGAAQSGRAGLGGDALPGVAADIGRRLVVAAGLALGLFERSGEVAAASSDLLPFTVGSEVITGL